MIKLSNFNNPISIFGFGMLFGIFVMMLVKLE